jgi:xylulose-5-phosphate/fructose-6-phosphate phosphoketolase
LRKALEMPDFRRYAVEVKQRGVTEAGNVPTLGPLLRDVMRQNRNNFRVFGPDETTSNRLPALYEATKKTWLTLSRSVRTAAVPQDP